MLRDLMYRYLLLLVLLLALAAAFTAPLFAQDYIRTINERTEGQRCLVLNGIFSGADSAYVQVYHDADELTSSVEVNTFSLTLGTYDHYIIKFTDQQRRVKYVYLIELSDNLTEFIPPIEVDFDRTGNIVLLKQSTGKPDFQEFDVGMSRKR